MEIRNAIIITDSDSKLEMSADDMMNFTGNTVFAQSKLSARLIKEIKAALGQSSNEDAAPANLRRSTKKFELVV